MNKKIIKFLTFVFFLIIFSNQANANPDYICTTEVLGPNCDINTSGVWDQDIHSMIYYGLRTVSISYSYHRTDCRVDAQDGILNTTQNWQALDLTTYGTLGATTRVGGHSYGNGASGYYGGIMENTAICSVVAIDNTLPTGEVSYSTTDWTNGDVTVTVSCNDNLSGCENGNYTKIVSENGSGYITINDKAGNSINIPYIVNNIDKTPPTILGVSCSGLNENNSSSGSVTCSASLGNTGPSQDTLNYTQTTQDGILPSSGGTGNTLSQQYTYTNNGTYTVGVTGQDEAGNTATGQSVTFTIDTSNPAVNTDFNFDTWYNNSSLSDIVFSAMDQQSSTQTDDAGLASFEVKINGIQSRVSGFSETDGNSSIDVTLPKEELLSKITQKANNTIEVKVTDKAGNITEVKYNLNYDNTSPTLSFNDIDSSWRNTFLVVDITTGDTISGLNSTRYKIGNELNSDCSDGNIMSSLLLDEDGTYQIYACSKDNAGNISRKIQEYKIDKTMPIISANGTEVLFYTGAANIILTTQDQNQGDITKSSQLKYSKYSLESACSETNGTDYTDGQNITLDTQGKHVLYLCNGDNAGNTNTWTYGSYIVDLTNPYIDLTGLPNTLIAGTNNLHINQKIHDDFGTDDTMLIYGNNFEVNYKVSIEGPIQNGYSGKVITYNLLNNYNGRVVNNANLNKDYSLTIAGNYQISVKLTDKSGRVYDYSKNITVYPADLDQTNTVITVDSIGTKYANNVDYYTYTLNLRDVYGNFIYGKLLNSITIDCFDIPGCKIIKTDMSNPNIPSGNNSLQEYGYNGVQSDTYGKITFYVKSLAPGEFTQRFKIILNDGTTIYKLSSNNSFLKLFTGSLSIVNSNKVLEIGPSLEMDLSVAQKNIVTSFSIDDFTNDIKLYDNINHKFANGPSNINSSSNMKYLFTVDAKTDAGVSIAPKIKLSNNPIISYILNGEDIKYRLSATTNDTGPIILNGILNNLNKSVSGIKIVGTSQLDGKSQLTSQGTNYTDLSTSDIRTQIRKNAYTYISSMTSGQIVNGVKYVVGEDVTISGNDLGYETLVVKDGNITISGNLNNSGITLGIIVLKDNYDVNNDYSNKGNIYVNEGVQTINAIIYADGGFISADNNGNPYTSDTLSRTNNLQKQLVLKGTLFTRNTIGGAIQGSSGYILPGGSITTDFAKAMLYDLNYVRRGNDGWNSINSSYNEGSSNYFVIVYDSTVQTNPPKLFGN
ncbi:MAG: hypothetical protein PHE25_04670 [Candidatus Gracilibacteria bacterium]|nr:hypothetical protein [Candidatus Gracilibacteria bacterium]